MDGMGGKARNRLTCTSRNVIEWTGWMQSQKSVIAERDSGIKNKARNQRRIFRRPLWFRIRFGYLSLHFNSKKRNKK